MNQDDITRLDRCLLSGAPILFTGAGFSLGAVNEEGGHIPSGDDLKSMILYELIGLSKSSADYNELIKSSLADICTYAGSVCSELKLKDFIHEKLSRYYPQSFHETILSFKNWSKVYTVNIDDVVENSRSSSRFVVQNSKRKISYSKADRIEYIKLHGCVRNIDGDIVFSNHQYVDSMLHSVDYRFNSFASDIQVENFIVIGTELSEVDLDYYVTLFSMVTNKTIHGQLFFINPKPSLVFLAKMKKIGAIILPWTTKEFADHLDAILSNSILIQDVDIKGLLDVRKRYKHEKSKVGYKSNLYFGNYPSYGDIVFDWDFINPSVTNLVSSLLEETSNSRGRRMLALYGKSMVGKSVYLKRIAVSLLSEGFYVFEYCGKDFDVEYFIKSIKSLPDPNIALIFDNASFYYREIARLLRCNSIDKNIVVVTAARSYSHFRKRYCLVSEYWYSEYCVSGETEEDVFAESIASRLDEKGLLGKIKALKKDERIRIIKKKNDVSSFLFDITNGQYYQNRVLKDYLELDKKLVRERDFLIQLAIFYKMNLPYFPNEVFALIYGASANAVVKNCEDYVTYFKDNNGFAIRNSFLVPFIMKGVSDIMKVRLLSEVLMYISPQVNDGYHSYWNEIASTLMKCRLLRRTMRLNNTMINNLLSKVKNYYNEDYNYWLQVGLAEQYDDDFEHALNHFQQAESLSPSSYLVKNAIARNFLRQANAIDDKNKAVVLMSEGINRMEQLIRDREEFQVRAYSTHCLLYERIRFFRKFCIIPDDESLETMYKQLKAIIDKNPDDPMSNHISNVFYKFVKDKNLTKKLPKMNLFDLNFVKSIVAGSEMSERDLLENFEIDE